MAPFLADSTQRSAAKTVGLVYLPAFILLAVANFGILQPMIGSGDPLLIAQNILANQTLFRLGALGILLYGGSVLVVSVALYVILRSVNQTLAQLALLGRIVNGLVWILVAINLLTALRLLTQPEYSGLLSNQQSVLARLFLSGFDQYYVGLLFWSAGATIGAFLWLKSIIIPRAIAIFGILSGVWCAACTLVLLVDPSFSKVVNLWLFDMPMLLFEIVLSFLLLNRAVRSNSAARAA